MQHENLFSTLLNEVKFKASRCQNESARHELEIAAQHIAMAKAIESETKEILREGFHDSLITGLNISTASRYYADAMQGD